MRPHRLERRLGSRTLTSAEVDHGLPTLVRLRWAVQADYFARRITTGDLTGITNHADNEKCLDEAHRHLRPPA